MHKITLSPEEKATLEERHKKCRDSIESDRIKAVLLRSESWTTTQIAQALRIHDSTVTRHLKDWKCQKKVTVQKGGSSSLLSQSQTKELIAHLSKNLYHHTHCIASYIKKRWGLTYSVSGLNKWLKRHHFVYKKPKGRPYKADCQAQSQFIKHYRDLKKSIKTDETLMFIDSVHPTQATKLSYGWIKKGQTREISTTAGRTRLNVIGAIDLNSLENTVINHYDRINTESMIDFLALLKKQYSSKKKIHLILDRAGYHRSEDLRKKAQLIGIEFHYLPPYSPNLNPIERLWKVMNEYVRNNRFFETGKEFKEKVLDFFEHTLPKIATQLTSRINDNFQRLKPAL